MQLIASRLNFVIGGLLAIIGMGIAAAWLISPTDLGGNTSLLALSFLPALALSAGGASLAIQAAYTSEARRQVVVLVFSLILILLGCVGLLEQVIGKPIISQINPLLRKDLLVEIPPMPLLTALCLILVGTALLVWRVDSNEDRRRKINIACGALILILGYAAILTIFIRAGWFGVEEKPGKLFLVTVLCFAACGFSLIVNAFFGQNLKNSGVYHLGQMQVVIAEILTASLGVFLIVSLIGFLVAHQAMNGSNNLALVLLFMVATFGMLLLGFCLLSIVQHFLEPFRYLAGFAAQLSTNKVDGIDFSGSKFDGDFSNAVPFLLEELKKKETSLKRLNIEYEALAEKAGQATGRRLLSTAETKTMTPDELHNQLDELRQQLAHAEWGHQLFCNNLSYFLKSPINAVLGWVELLRSNYFGKASDKQKEVIEHIQSLGEIIAKRVSNVKELEGSTPPDAIVINPVTFEIKDVVQDAIQFVNRQASEKSIVIQVKGSCQAVTADKDRIRQVIITFLGNAIRSSLPRKSVIIQMEEKKDLVIFSISDEGISIPSSNHSNIFDEEAVAIKMSRVGLIACKQIIKAHGGDVAMESGKNIGNTFSWSIPRNAEMRLPSIQIDERTKRDPLDVLVINSDPEACKLLDLLLTSEGFAIGVAQDADEAFRILGRFKPSAIVMEQTLAGITGKDLLQAIRKVPALRDLPVYVLSTFEESPKGWAKELGVREFMRQPLSPERLINALMSAIPKVSLTIEVVSTDQQLLNKLSDTLEKSGSKVNCIKARAQAFPTAIANKPNIMIYDLGNPDAADFEVISLIKNNAMTKQIAMIYLLGDNLTEPQKNTVRSHALGCFIRKDLNIDSFPQEVRKLIRANRAAH